MRLMDGLMAIPAILLCDRTGLAVPRRPRQRHHRHHHSGDPARRTPGALHRAVGARGAYVEAAIMAGTRTPLLLVRHILPNTIPALIVQGTFICANAILNRSNTVFPWHRYSARDADLGQHHGRGARALSHLSAQHLLSRHLPCADRACRQRAGRRPGATGSIRNLQGGCK